ncbi:hypothetical protein [Novosphingobium nitrogenifigens]|uniref:hypothetical protein n=1 Tax=Novosphingobium nitrogenifigens TaxID=378548 RepID=UPI00037FFFEE
MPKHVAIYVGIIAFFSLIQLVMGANVFVLAAIDLVALTGVIPLRHRTFDPIDTLLFSLSLYYGTFSLILKTVVGQPVQRNLLVATTSLSLLVIGFGLITSAYFLVSTLLTRHYPGTRLRRWNVLEQTFSDQQFLERFTVPVMLFSLALCVVNAMVSATASDLSSGAGDSGFGGLGNFVPIIQLAFAMQLSLVLRRGARKDWFWISTATAVLFVLAIVNNQKATFLIVVATILINGIAYRVKVRPRVIAAVVVVAAISFLYLSPAIYIVRGMQVSKLERIGLTFSVLAEADFNPIRLYELQDKITNPGGAHSHAADVDYLSPHDYHTDRFTLLMPVDNMAREGTRKPIGVGTYLSLLIKTILPSAIIGQHSDTSLGELIAWRFGITQTGNHARLVLGILGTAYGTGGPFGLLILAPLFCLILFAILKLSCNGSIWQNPWAIFVASRVFFYGEADISTLAEVIRGFLPIVLFAYGLTLLHKRKRPSTSPSTMPLAT